MKNCLLMAVAVILTGGALASAANREGQFSVSPVIGGYTYDDKQGRESDANLIYGVRAGYNLTKRIGFEGLFDYVDSSDRGNNIQMYRYGGEILYHLFPDRAFVPYLAAGYAGLSFDGSGIGGNVHGAFDYGIGAKYFIQDSFALRADFRHLIYNMDSRTNNNLEYTLGVYIPLGTARTAVKPVAPAPDPALKVAEAPPVPPDVPATEPEPLVRKTSTYLVADVSEAPAGKILVTGLKLVNDTIEIHATERIRDYNVFTLTGPSRLVIDIPNAVSGFKQNIIRIDELGIASLRFESHPEYLRIFLDAAHWQIIPYRIEETDRSMRVIITKP